MPITLNHQRGENQIVQQADFGTGDILIMSAKDIDGTHDNQVWLVQNEPKPKDQWESHQDERYATGTSTEDMPQKPTIVLAFHDRDSIVSLVRTLMAIHAQMPVPASDTSTEPTPALKARPANLLDETGFVFLDSNKAYWVRMWEGYPWLFYWHPDNRWVSLRRTNQNEIWLANERRLPSDKADLYHELNNRHQ